MGALSALTEFALGARAHDDALDLERLTIGIARMGTPGLDAHQVSMELDRLASLVAARLDPNASPDTLAAQLGAAFGGELDLRGDEDQFREPESSFLDHVLARRRGLPILLSVTWVLLGQRLGLPIAGVNYPGHFLVCLDPVSPEKGSARIYLDPFHGGRVRDAGELMARLGTRAPDRRVLDPSPIRPIVTRMLVNLKNLWVDLGDYQRALGAVDRILLIAGEQPMEMRDRGLICLHLERPADAARDFRHYLKVHPEAEDREVIETLLQKIEET